VQPFALDLCSGIRSVEGYDLDQELARQVHGSGEVRQQLGPS
jgi:hypothetical protein